MASSTENVLTKGTEQTTSTQAPQPTPEVHEQSQGWRYYQALNQGQGGWVAPAGGGPAPSPVTQTPAGGFVATPSVNAPPPVDVSAPQKLVFIETVEGQGKGNVGAMIQTQSGQFQALDENVEKAVLDVNQQIVSKGATPSDYNFNIAIKPATENASGFVKVSAEPSSSATILMGGKQISQSRLQSQPSLIQTQSSSYSNVGDQQYKALLEREQKALSIPEKIKTAGGILTPSPSDNLGLEIAKGFARGVLSVPAGLISIPLGIGAIAAEAQYRKEHQPEALTAAMEQIKKDIKSPAAWYEATAKPIVESIKQNPAFGISEVVGMASVFAAPKLISVVRGVEVPKIIQAEKGIIRPVEGEIPTNVQASKIITKIGSKEYESGAFTISKQLERQGDITKTVSLSKVGTKLGKEVQESVVVGKQVTVPKEGYDINFAEALSKSKKGTEEFAGKYVSKTVELPKGTIISVIGKTASQKGTQGIYEGIFKVEKGAPTEPSYSFTTPDIITKETHITPSTQAAENAMKTAVDSYKKDISPSPNILAGAGAYFSTIGTIKPKSQQAVVPIISSGGSGVFTIAEKKKLATQPKTETEVQAQPQTELFASYQGPFPMTSETQQLLQQQKLVQNIKEDSLQGRFPVQNISNQFGLAMPKSQEQPQAMGLGLSLSQALGVSQELGIGQQQLQQVQTITPSLTEPVQQILPIITPVGFGFRESRKGMRRIGRRNPWEYSLKIHPMKTGEQAFKELSRGFAPMRIPKNAGFKTPRFNIPKFKMPKFNFGTAKKEKRERR